MRELNTIQTRLVAPKNQKNDFGKYNYRSLEDIMEAVKPLLRELNCTITFTDELTMLGDRIFCKSTAILKNEKGETETSTSFAELDNHKGMSKEQSSGSSSSYARKYAVCSLLAIDDNADPDMLDNRASNEPTYQPYHPDSINRSTGLKSGNNEGLDNATILKNFCNGVWKSLSPEEQEKMKKFNAYWSKRITEGTFSGIINPAKLWDNELKRAS